MLIRFHTANFRSLRDDQELSMVAAFKGDRTDLVRAESLGIDLLRVAGIYGANAAGKSNVLAALRFMRDAVRLSHRSWLPEGPISREPFLFDATARSNPSEFEADLWIDDILYTYGFSLDDRKIREEWLYASPRGRRQLWFSRDPEEGFKFGKHMKGNNRALQRLTRDNSLFLSVAAENNHQALLPIYSWFAKQLRFTRHENRDRQLSCSIDVLKSEFRELLVNLLRRADLGIVDIHQSSAGGIQVLEFIHRSKEGAFRLPLESESRGTQILFSLSGPILDALVNGALLCVDELDASLHPNLALEVIRIFQDSQLNPKNAQLIFNTHDTTLLGGLLEEPALHRDQIWFVEKDAAGATHLYPLTDFKPRKFENIERGYLMGRYGGTPVTVPLLAGRNG
jgi:AAA15 family ATPase/GTPase